MVKGGGGRIQRVFHIIRVIKGASLFVSLELAEQPTPKGGRMARVEIETRKELWKYNRSHARASRSLGLRV
jgi:hypothetical protein